MSRLLVPRRGAGIAIDLDQDEARGVVRPLAEVETGDARLAHAGLRIGQRGRAKGVDLIGFHPDMNMDDEHGSPPDSREKCIRRVGIRPNRPIESCNATFGGTKTMDTNLPTRTAEPAGAPTAPPFLPWAGVVRSSCLVLHSPTRAMPVRPRSPHWLRLCLGSALTLAAAAPLRAVEAVEPGASRGVLFIGWLVALAIGLGLGWFAHRLQHRPLPGKTTHAHTPDGLIAALAAPTLLYDSHGQWLAANPAARLFFSERNMTAEECGPRDLTERILGCVTSRKAEILPEVAVGTIWVRWLLEPTSEGFVRATLTDATESTKRETALVRERDAALAAARSTSEFVATLSHDIRVPMNGVLGMANLLLEAGLTPQQREMARSVVESAENVITLTDELLDLAKIEAGKLEINPQPVELGPALDELLRSQAARAAEKRLDLACDVDPTLPAIVHLDPTRLRQILGNLLSNALKFTERGEVGLRVWVETPSGMPAELRFAVRDTGIGIPPDQRDRLFQAFGQADASTYGLYGGTGLGLVTSRRLAELMGGRVWFESEPNRGSTFFLALPFQPSDDPAPPAWAQAQPHLQNRDILVIEDNPRLNSLLAGWIARWGARPVSFRNLPELCAWLDTGGRATVAVVDLDLPERGGPAVLRMLSQLQPPPRLVAAAARPPEASTPLAGAEVLLKPITPDAVLELLRRPPRPVAPPAPPPSPAATPPPPPKAAVASPRARVIVADDDLVNQKVMRTFLERLGCEVRLAANGVEALALVGVGPCDVLFLDIMMPRLDGLQTVRELRRLETERHNAGQTVRRLPVVAITAKVMPGDRENGIAAGFDDYATKPISDSRLREALQKFVPNFQPPGPLSAGTTMLAAPQIQLIDRERLNELASGDRDTMREIVALFFERMEALLPDIESTLKSGDLVEARRHAHTGAGSCATCGVMQGQNVMRRLERSIEAGQVEHSRSLLGEVRRVLAAARESLADLIPPPK